MSIFIVADLFTIPFICSGQGAGDPIIPVTAEAATEQGTDEAAIESSTFIL